MVRLCFLLCAKSPHSKMQLRLKTAPREPPTLVNSRRGTPSFTGGFLHFVQFVFLFAFAIRSPSKPVCASLAGSLLQTGSWGDTASRKHPTGAFSLANLSRYASVRSRRRRTVGIQASGRKREFCICLRAPGSMAGAVCFLNVTEEWDVEDAVPYGAGGGRKLPKRCRGSPKRTIRRAELSIYNELGK